jgi:hypothetical protein
MKENTIKLKFGKEKKSILKITGSYTTSSFGGYKIITDHKFMSTCVNLCRMKDGQIIGVAELQLIIDAELKDKSIGILRSIGRSKPKLVRHNHGS